MSYRALNWAWESALPTTQKFVLVALADMADERNTCFPGQERLASMIGGSVSTVHRAVKDLEAAGYVTRVQRRGADGMRTSDRYHLNVNRSDCRVDGGGHRSNEVGSPVNDADLTGHSDRVTTREPSVEPPVLLSDESDNAFQETLQALWELWPVSRRSTRKVVQKSLHAASKAARLPVIVGVAHQHAEVWASWPAADVKYVPLLSTWLNQERWTGSLPEPRGGRMSAVDTGRAAHELLMGREQLAVSS